MLDREQWRHLVMLEDDLALRVEDEADVEEAIRPIRMMRLGLRHNECVVLLCDCAQRVGFAAGNVDCAFTRERDVVEIEYLVVEALQRAFWYRDQTHRQLDWLSHYDLLGVSRKATQGEIEEAYRARSLLFDPSLKAHPELVDCWRQLTVLTKWLRVAYRMLSNPETREAYDRKIEGATPGGPPANPSE